MTDASTTRREAETTDSSPHLESGHLSLKALVALSLASFFPAVAIALAPYVTYSSAGITGWQSSLLATIAVIFIGRAIIVFARRYVAKGLIYSYVGEVFGTWAKWLAGAAMLAGFIVGLAAFASICGIFIGSFLSARGISWALDLGPQIVVFGLVLSLAGAIAFRGLDTSVTIAVVLAVLALPLVLVITAASARHTGLHWSEQFSYSGFSFGHTLQGIAVGAAFLIAFESCAALATETRNPRKNIPVAIMSVPVILGGILPIATILQAPGLASASEQLAAGVSAPAALAAQAGLSPWIGSATDLVLALASFAALIGFVNYGSRYLMTLAEDGILPPLLTRIHSRHHTPHIAIVIVVGISFLCDVGLSFLAGSVSAAYLLNANLLVFLWVIPYVLICVAAIVITVREKEIRPGLWLTTILGGAAMVWSFVNGIINPPPAPGDVAVWVAIAAVVVIVGIFAICRGRHRQIH
ncbi:APC family permease [Rhodococcus pseudokoreensis]|uniref:APC family permease n=2 Tax=Rhodococcus pseudokoreensis TaxID=2811421 RepID=A0A974ZYY5_9NOCA|nr:APC family permease [Rhodococcus pseudokoreensis]